MVTNAELQGGGCDVIGVTSSVYGEVRNDTRISVGGSGWIKPTSGSNNYRIQFEIFINTIVR
jgi:hypothetical protein